MRDYNKRKITFCLHLKGKKENKSHTAYGTLLKGDMLPSFRLLSGTEVERIRFARPHLGSTRPCFFKFTPVSVHAML